MSIMLRQEMERYYDNINAPKEDPELAKQREVIQRGKSTEAIYRFKHNAEQAEAVRAETEARIASGDLKIFTVYQEPKKHISKSWLGKTRREKA